MTHTLERKWIWPSRQEHSWSGLGMGMQRDCSHLALRGHWALDSQYPMRTFSLGFSILDRILQGELRRLKWQHEEATEVPALTEGSAEVAQGHCNEELLAEARILRQHKSRLETRMQILEDHNKQLESQLQRLRELLLQVGLGLGEEPEQPLGAGGLGRLSKER